MYNNGNISSWSPYVKIYDPLKAGSIDGTDLIPHDNAIVRAICAEYVPPDEQTIASNPKLTLFVGRLNLQTSERQLNEEFSKYGNVKSCRVIQDIATGLSRGYGFVEFKKEADAQKAWRVAHGTNFHDRQIIVEWEFARTMPGWIPRRLGGGLGGRKESGQLRFGGRDRPFRKPFILPRVDEPSSSVTESSQKYFTNMECNSDDLKNREKDQNEAKFSSSKYEGDGRSSSSRHYNDGDRTKYRRQAEEKSEYYYHGRHSDMRDDSYTEQYPQGRRHNNDRRKYGRQAQEKLEYSYQGGGSSEMIDDSYGEQYSQRRRYEYRSNNLHSSKKYESYDSLNYEGKHPHGRSNHWTEKVKTLNYGEKYSHSRCSDSGDYKSPNRYLENEHYNKRDERYHKESKRRKEHQSDINYSDSDPSYFDAKLDLQKDSQKNQYDIRVSHKEVVKQRRKREHSSDTSSSCESSSKSKPKKSKHKKKKQKGDASDSECSLDRKSNKKHKKRKKKKSKRKHSSGESD